MICKARNNMPSMQWHTNKMNNSRCPKLIIRPWQARTREAKEQVDAYDKIRLQIDKLGSTDTLLIA